MAIIIFAFSGSYNKTHIQSIYNVTGRKLKPGSIVIINLFWERILLQTLSLQMTYTINLSVKNRKYGLQCVYICIYI